MSKAPHERRFSRGGLLQNPDEQIRLAAGGSVYAVEVWHWWWFAPASNWRNRHRHGWTIVERHRRLLYEQVLMVKYVPPSKVVKPGTLADWRMRRRFAKEARRP